LADTVIVKLQLDGTVADINAAGLKTPGAGNAAVGETGPLTGNQVMFVRQALQSQADLAKPSKAST
jgi:hypothetical protein